MISDLDGAYERVFRAEEHLLQVGHEIKLLYCRQEEALTCRFNADPPHKLVVESPRNFPMPPLRLGILIGEVCYNLRAAMDYLTYALAKLDSGQNQPLTQFPICDSRELFESEVKKGRLKGLNTSHVAAIECIQPYNGVKWATLLRDFSNRDKHREFVLIAGGFSAVGHARNEVADFDALPYPIRRAPRHPQEGKIEVKLDFTARVTFDDGAPIVQTLEVIKIGVREALDRFKPDFD